MPEGKIIKALSGFFYVESADGIIECKPRGKVRKGAAEPVVGDRVRYSLSGGKGVLEEILPRKNFLVRPPVANLDALVILCANTIPVTDPFLVDRITVIGAARGIPSIIVINKTDLDAAAELASLYRKAGFPTYCTSAETGEGIPALTEALAGKTVAFTGNSGVGKSSLLNRIQPGLRLQTGEVSDKLGRGRHTTRHVELFLLPNGTRIADTPGFSSFDTERMDYIPKEELDRHFPDFEPCIGKCRFRDCSHRKEPDCAVRGAVESGEISQSRYDSYLRLYQIASEIKEWE